MPARMGRTTEVHGDDPIYQKMHASWQADPKTWEPLTHGLRDAMVKFAAEHCPYYARMGVGNRTFEKIPLLTKSIIRENAEGLLAEGGAIERRIPKITSGSTGQPLKFYRDMSEGPICRAARHFLKQLHRVPESATMVWIGTRPSTVDKERVHQVPVPELTSERAQEEARLWTSFDQYWLYGHASAIDWVAAVIEERRLPARNPPSCVITTADLLTEHAEQRIGRVFRCPVHSWYGSNEFDGFLAGTIPGTRRYVFNPLLAYVEVLRDDGEPVRPGETGNLVVTDLNNYVFPFIRYVTGDLATVGSERMIGGWTIVERIEGRSSEIIQLPNGHILTPVILGHLLFLRNDFGSMIRFYQCAQTAHDRLELRLVWQNPPSPEDRSRIEAALHGAVGPEMKVRIADIACLDKLPSGKTWILRREFS